MKIDAGLDTGDILLQKEIPIDPTDTSETLSPKLASPGADLLIETLRRLQDGTIKSKPQDHTKATLAPILKKEDGKMDFHRTAQEIHNRLRGFQPWPGAFTQFRGKNLQVTQAVTSMRPAANGELLIENNQLLVGCAGKTALEILELQLEGKRRMPAKDFIHGYHPKTGEKLGTENW
jgi:methionyl-tRNA formyltransferase